MNPRSANHVMACVNHGANRRHRQQHRNGNSSHAQRNDHVPFSSKRTASEAGSQQREEGLGDREGGRGVVGGSEGVSGK